MFESLLGGDVILDAGDFKKKHNSSSATLPLMSKIFWH
jgi:hypothetical protein